LPSSTPAAADCGTRRKRRDAVRLALDSLAAVRDAELRSLENTPDNFQNSDSFETGQMAVDALDDIIGLLSDVY